MYKITFLLRDGNQLNEAGEAILDYQSTIALYLTNREQQIVNEERFNRIFVHTEDRPKTLLRGDNLRLRIVRLN